MKILPGSIILGLAALAVCLAASPAFGQSQRSFTGDGRTQAAACDSAKKFAALIGYTRTGSCACDKDKLLERWVCQVDGFKK